MKEGNKQIFDDIISVLKHVIHGIKIDDANEIKEWSDHIIHNASIYQDKHSIRTSILVYALSKLFERTKYEKKHKAEWDKFWKKITIIITEAINHIEIGDVQEFENDLKKIFNMTSVADKKFSEYVQYVLEKAKIKKAWKIYEHGVSLGRVAELLGVSQWEAMSYLGHTKTHEHPKIISVNIKKRFEKTKKIFEKN